MMLWFFFCVDFFKVRIFMVGFMFVLKFVWLCELLLEFVCDVRSFMRNISMIVMRLMKNVYG